VISPSQGLYLHRTKQHRKTRTNIHALSGIRTHDPSNQPAKTHASDRTATVTGTVLLPNQNIIDAKKMLVVSPGSLNKITQPVNDTGLSGGDYAEANAIFKCDNNRRYPVTTVRD
jgi:hypothetical protein